MLCCLIPSNAYDHFKQGLNILATHEVDFPIEAFLDVVKTSKENPDALKIFNSAIEHFDQAIKSSNEEFDEAWLAKGITHYFMREFEKVIESFDKVLEINSKVNDLLYPYSVFWMYRGASFNFLGKYDDAIKSFENAIQCSHNRNWVYEEIGFDEVFLGIGYALYQTGKSDKARPYFEIGTSGILKNADTFAVSTYKQTISEIEKTLGITVSPPDTIQNNVLKREIEAKHEEISSRNSENYYDELKALFDKKMFHDCIKQCNEILNYDLRDSFALYYKIKSLIEIDEPKKALYFCGFRTRSHDEERTWWRPIIEKCLDKLGVETEYPYGSARLTNPYYKYR